MIIAIQTFIFFRQTLAAFLARFLRPGYFDIWKRKSIKGDDEDDSEDEDIEEFAYAEQDEDKGVVFFPPVYMQRYAAVTDCLMENVWRGKIEKVVELGYHDQSFMKYLREIPGVKTILGVDIEDATLQRSFHKFGDDLTDTNNTHITMFQGNAADPDYRLIGCDAVVAIEMIEHMLPHDLERLVHTVFGFTKPRIAIFTTPNADFNELFNGLESNGLRRLDHYFEWTREQFNEWCANIVSRYPDYKVSCRGIGPGPAGTRHLGCCSQMALFEATNYQKQQDLAPKCFTFLADAPPLNLTHLIDETVSNDVPVSEKSLSLHSVQPISFTSILCKPYSSTSFPLYCEEKYLLYTFGYCDQISQCNMELELARNYLMFDQFDEMMSTILVPRRSLYEKVYKIEDVIARLNCTTYVVTKFSKFARKLMEKFKKTRPPVTTQNIVAQVTYLSDLFDINKQDRNETIWHNFNWGENAPYWNEYYRVVNDNLYPHNVDSEDNLILEQAIEEVSRCVDDYMTDDWLDEERLYIPIGRLMKVVFHLTRDVNRVKELLEWNGYVIENDAVVYTPPLDIDRDVGLWTDDTSERLSTEYTENMSGTSPEYNGQNLHRCIHQKLNKLRNILCNNADLDIELEKVLHRLTKLAICSKANENVPSSLWMQRKLYELLALTERAIEIRRLHFVQNFTLSDNSEHGENKSEMMMALKKYKEADSKTSAIEVKYKHLVEDSSVVNNVPVKGSKIPTSLSTNDEGDTLKSNIEETTPSQLIQMNDIINIEKSTNYTFNLRTMKFYQNCLMKYAKHRLVNKNRSMKWMKKVPKRFMIKDSPKKTYFCTVSKSKTGKFGQKQKDKNTCGRRYSSALSTKPIPESLIKLCHPELSTEKYVKNIWLADTVDGTEQLNKNEAILEAEESQLISIVMDDADDTTSLPITTVIDEDTTIDDFDYKTPPGSNKLRSMCFYKKNTSTENSEAMFINDVNEPSTSKGFRHVNMDAKCGPDVVLSSESKDNLPEVIVECDNKEFGTAMDDKEAKHVTVSWNKFRAGIFIKDSVTNTNMENRIVRTSSEDENVINDYSSSFETDNNETIIHNVDCNETNHTEKDDENSNMEHNLIENVPKNRDRKLISDKAVINSKYSDTSHDIIFQGTWKSSGKIVKITTDEFLKENIPHNQIRTVLQKIHITDQVSINSSDIKKISNPSGTDNNKVQSCNSTKTKKTTKIKNKVKDDRSVKVAVPGKSDKTTKKTLKESSDGKKTEIKNKSASNDSFVLPKLPALVKILVFDDEEFLNPIRSDIQIQQDPSIQPAVSVEGNTSECKAIDIAQTDLKDISHDIDKNQVKEEKREQDCKKSNDLNPEEAKNTNHEVKSTKIDIKEQNADTKTNACIKLTSQNITNVTTHKVDTVATSNAESKRDEYSKTKMKATSNRPHSAFPAKIGAKSTVKYPAKTQNMRKNITPERNDTDKKIFRCTKKAEGKKYILERAKTEIKPHSLKMVSEEQSENEKQTYERSNTESSINVKRSKRLIKVTLEGKHENVNLKIPSIKMANTEMKTKQTKFNTDLETIQKIMRDENERLKLLKQTLTNTNNEPNIDESVPQTLVNDINCKSEITDPKDNKDKLNYDFINSKLSKTLEVIDKHIKTEQLISKVVTSHTDTDTTNTDTDEKNTNGSLSKTTDLDDSMENPESKILFTVRSNPENNITIHKGNNATSHDDFAKSKIIKSRKYFRSSLLAQTEKPSFSVTQKRLKRYKAESLRGLGSKNLKSKVRLSRSKVEELQKDLMVLKIFDNERNYMVFCNEVKSKSSDIDCVTPKSSKTDNKKEDVAKVLKKTQCSSSNCSTSNSVITVKSFGSFGTKPLSDSSVTASNCKAVTDNTTNSTNAGHTALTKHKSRKNRLSKYVADKLKMVQSAKNPVSNKKEERFKIFKGKNRNVLLSQCLNSDSSGFQSPSQNKCIIKVPSTIKKLESIVPCDTVIREMKPFPDVSENAKNVESVTNTTVTKKRPLEPCFTDSPTDIPSPKREKLKTDTPPLVILNNVEIKANDANYQSSTSKVAETPVDQSQDCTTNQATVDNFAVEVSSALENLITDETLPVENTVNNDSEDVNKKTAVNNENAKNNKNEEHHDESAKRTEMKVEDAISITTDTDCLSYRSITSASTYSDAYLADNELTSLGTLKPNISSVTELFERSDQFTVQTANGQQALPFQAFSGFSMNMAPLSGDIADYCNLIDSETGSVAATRPRQATSEEVLGGGISSESFTSCMVEDDSVVPDWLFAIMTQHHELDESSVATRPSIDLPEEHLVDVNGNLEPGVGLASGAGDGRGIHSQQDSSGQGMSTDSSGSSSPPQSEVILIDPSNFTQFEALLESIESTDASNENIQYIDSDSLTIQGRHMSPGVNSLSADADISSTGTDGTNPNDTSEP